MYINTCSKPYFKGFYWVTSNIYHVGISNIKAYVAIPLAMYIHSVDIRTSNAKLLKLLSPYAVVTSKAYILLCQLNPTCTHSISLIYYSTSYNIKNILLVVGFNYVHTYIIPLSLILYACNCLHMCIKLC